MVVVSACRSPVCARGFVKTVRGGPTRSCWAHSVERRALGARPGAETGSIGEKSKLPSERPSRSLGLFRAAGARCVEVLRVASRGVWSGDLGACRLADRVLVSRTRHSVAVVHTNDATFSCTCRLGDIARKTKGRAASENEHSGYPSVSWITTHFLHGCRRGTAGGFGRIHAHSERPAKSGHAKGPGPKPRAFAIQ